MEKETPSQFLRTGMMHIYTNNICEHPLGDGQTQLTATSSERFYAVQDDLIFRIPTKCK